MSKYLLIPFLLMSLLGGLMWLGGNSSATDASPGWDPNGIDASPGWDPNGG